MTGKSIRQVRENLEKSGKAWKTQAILYCQIDFKI